MKARPTMLAGGKARITWTETWDREDTGLTYTVQRRIDVTQPWVQVAKVKAASKPWRLRRLTATDKSLVRGTRYAYRIVVADPAGNTWPSSPSKPLKAR